MKLLSDCGDIFAKQTIEYRNNLKKEGFDTFIFNYDSAVPFNGGFTITAINLGAFND